MSLLPDKEAFAKLDAAIKEYNASMGQPHMVMEWVVIAASHRVNDDGTTGTAYLVQGSDEVAMHRVYGLINYGKKFVESVM